MIYDEVQAGFGRTGKLFGYQHYDVEADIVCLGKAITGCIPISATLARNEIMDVFPPGEMTSTHTGNPVGCAAGIANLDLLVKEKLVERSAKVGEVFKKEIDKIVDKHPIAGWGAAHGLFGGIHAVTPGTKTPRKDLAYKVNQKLYEKGIMIFAPVGPATIKLAPPLIIPEDALLEATAVIDEAIGEVEKEEKLV